MSATIRGELKRSEIVNGNQEQIWEIPAFREQGARRRARRNAQIKGLNNITILKVEEIRPGRLPRQTVFRVTLEAPR